MTGARPQDRTGWRGLLRRWRWPLIALVVLVAVRIALPYIVRSVAESQASKALQTKVSIGDVSLSLLRGAVEVRDVGVELPPAVAQLSGDEGPVVGWKRLAVNLAFLPLLHHVIRFDSIEIESPRISVVRLADGSVQLQKLIPPSAPEPEAKEPPGRPWGIALDSFVLRDGGVRFDDKTITDFEPLQLRLPDITVRDFAFQTPDPYGEPSHIVVQADVEGGSIALDARLALRDSNALTLAADLTANRLPLRRSRLYIPRVGWSGLDGRLDLALHYERETDAKDLLSGSMKVDDLAVHVKQYDSPAIAWKRLDVAIDHVDLRAQDAAVASVALDGLSLLTRTTGPDPLPILHGLMAGDGKAPGGSSSAATTPTAPPPPAKPWRWSVGKVALTNAHLRVLGPEKALDVDLGAEVGTLRSAGGAAPVRLAIGVEGGTLDLDGEADPLKPTFAGTLRLKDVPAHELVGAAAVLPPHLVQRAIVGGELGIGVGVAAPGADGTGDPGGVQVRGRVSLSDVWVATDAREFAVGWKGLDVPLDEVHLPGILPGAKPPTPAPVQVRLGAVKLDQPYALVTRAPEGLLLPQLGAQPTAAAPDAGAKPEAPPAAPADAKPAQAPPAALEFAAVSANLSKGRVIVVDRSVKPFYRGQLSPLDVDAKGIRYPALTIQKLRVDTRTDETGTLRIVGAIGPKSTLEINGKAISLAAFNPYATSYSPYSIGKGKLFVTTKATFGEGGYDSSTNVTLSDFDVNSKDGGSAFAAQFGVPLSMALALLRDVSGNIVIDVPVAGDRQGTKVGVGTIVGGALSRALLNALASPLKLVGAVLPGGDGEGKPIGPQPIAFPVGRADLGSEGEQGLDQLAAFLASRPGIGVEFDPTPSVADVRWLREQALRRQLESQSLLSQVASVTERGSRNAILKALAAREKGEPDELTPEQQQTLDRWLDERAPATPAMSKALADARIAAADAALAKEHGIDASRVARSELAESPPDGPSGLRIKLVALRP